MTDLPSDADVLILGGGSAGCVLAARLSARADLSVVLVEAGPDTRGPLPADIASPYPGRAYFNPAYTWPGLEATIPKIMKAARRQRGSETKRCLARTTGGASG